jgi:dTDP-4-amino-4,6-dideoxy-D-galactose acyltransferase
MTIPSQACCTILDWDTQFFGFRIARVNGDTLTPESIQGLDKFCLQNQVRCLYFLSTIQEPTTTFLAEKHDFKWVDIRLTFEKMISGSSHLRTDDVSNKLFSIRLARKTDIAALVEISRNSYIDSRFYFDTNFPRPRAEALYQTWIQVSCEGWAQAVLVAEKDQIPVGYITCHIDQEKMVGNIGLVGVNSQVQGHGVGKTLVFNALDWFYTQGMDKVTVVTQGRNLPAQRLYQRCGFITQNIQLWYHKWYPPSEK